MEAGLAEEEYKKKKVLIIEDDEGVANSLKRWMEIVGKYIPGTLVEDKETILSDLEKEVKRFLPDAAIIDGLDGKCFEVIDRIEKIKPGAVCVIYAGDPDSTKRDMPEGKKYKIFRKPKQNKEMFDYIDSKLRP